MNFNSFKELCNFLLNDEISFHFALQNNLIKRNRICDCGGELIWAIDNSEKYGYRFRCSKSRKICKNSYSILHGTWFWKSNLSLTDQILIIYCYCLEISSCQLKGMINISSSNTTADWMNYFNDICAIYLSETNNEKIGGIGRIVEIDESLIFKRKNNRGRISVSQQEKTWLFGGICRETKDTFFKLVSDRTESTLMQVLQDNVIEGTTIYSDQWRGYLNLEAYGYNHSTVNHSENFLSPEDNTIHTQTIERTWRGIKESIPLSTRYAQRERLIIQYIFKKKTNWFNLTYSERFNLLLRLISNYY